MVISVLAYRVALYGLIAATVIAVATFTTMANRRRAKRDPIPEARTRPARTWVILIPVLVMFASPPLAWKLFRARHSVAFVRDDDGTITVERRVYLGDPPYRRAPGFESAFARDTWVVNETSRELRISQHQYGEVSTLRAPQAKPVPAGMAAIVVSLDFIGPDDPPPSEVMVKADGAEGITAHATRGWLTWDR